MWREFIERNNGDDFAYTVWHFGDFALHRPMTAITDWAITVACVVCLYVVRKVPGEAARFWRLWFGFFGLALFLAGSAHGFFNPKTGVVWFSVWMIGHVATLFAPYFAARAGIVALVEPAQRGRWRVVADVSAVIVAAILVRFPGVTAPGMYGWLVMLLVLGGYGVRRRRVWAVLSLMSLILGVVNNAVKPELATWFNHKDLTHLFEIAFVSFQAAGLRRDARSELNDDHPRTSLGERNTQRAVQ